MHNLKRLISRGTLLLHEKLYIAWLLFFVISAVVSIGRSDMPFISQWDELYHLSYVQYASQGIVPANGFPLNDWSKVAFSCYPVSLLGMTTDVPCGEVGAGARYPTGGTNTAAIWPPIYYFLTALLMAPIKILFGVSDNLFAARYATGLIWAAGTALLSVIVLSKSKSILLSGAFALLATSLSLFGQSASFVSPHSTVPLLLAIGLLFTFRLERQIDSFFGQRNWGALRFTQWFKELLSWGFPIVLFGFLLALTVPHAFPILLVMGIYVFVGVVVKYWASLPFVSLLTLGICSLFGLSAGGFFLATRIWEWQRNTRGVSFPSDVNTAAADVTATSAYPDFIQQLLALWWDFWPMGLSNPWLQGAVAIFIENVWIFLLPSLLIAALATLGLSNWLSRVALGVVVSAPVASNLAFSSLQFVIPERYGLSIVILGLFGLANDRFTRLFRIIIFLGALATYVISFLYSPLPFAIEVCPPGLFNGALGCVLP